MAIIPRDKSLDSTLALLREGYHFLPNRQHRYQSDIIELRLLGQKVVALSGEEGARVFYDNTRFQREGALPRRIQTTLMGQHGVQTLDDEKHRHRKAMFTAMMTPGSLHHYTKLLTQNWHMYLRRWEMLDQVVLFPEVEQVLCRTACQWAGVPFEEKDIRPLARDLSAMIDAFGGVGLRHWRGKRARNRAERWVGKMIEEVRAGKLVVAEDKPLYAVAEHQETDGTRLPTKIAAVELLNLIRPIVAIARFVVFEALALHQHPECRGKLQTGEGEYPELFAQEVRRLYPFTPLLGAKVRRDFEWQGYRFRQGMLVLLNVHGINHDERLWHLPGEFCPERFRSWSGSPFSFIPQGGGDHNTGHRCAGEWLTIETLKVTAVLLASAMRYEVPTQDLTVSLRRMPTLPASSFVIRSVQATGHAGLETMSLGKCPFHHA